MTTTATPTLTALSPAEIDTAWQEALKPAESLELQIRSAERSLEIEQRGAERHGDESYYGREVQKSYERLNDLREALDEAYLAEQPFKAEWQRRGGWQRYYLVSGGKLHDYTCFTLTPGRTLIGLLCEASGLTPDEAIARYNVTVCTHCWPDAPTEAKLTPEQEGYCKLSGTYLTEESRQWLTKQRGPGWQNLCVAPAVKCPECDGRPSVTKGGKYRKHKRGERPG